VTVAILPSVVFGESLLLIGFRFLARVSLIGPGRVKPGAVSRQTPSTLVSSANRLIQAMSPISIEWLKERVVCAEVIHGHHRIASQSYPDVASSMLEGDDLFGEIE